MTTIVRLGENDWARAAANIALFWEDPCSEQSLRDFLSSESNILVVAEVDGKPVGQVVGYILPRWEVKPRMLFLFSIDVVDSHRRHGIGRKLIERFREIGSTTGCGSTFVFTNESNLPAMRLYENLGGKRTNSDDVMYEWK